YACAAQGSYFGATSSLPNSRSTTIGPAISALKLRMCCPTSLRCFSQGSKILRCKAWEKDLIRATVFLAAGISATCLPPATPYSPGRNVVSMPSDDLHATWQWNYHCAERQRRNPGLF